MRLNYAIKSVSDMDAAVAFYRDALGLTLAFQSPFWSEFDTGETRLALHPASDENPAGSVQLASGPPTSTISMRPDRPRVSSSPARRSTCTATASPAFAMWTERRSASAASEVPLPALIA
jgi:catechol 2,3-dioxygenase-like lactoylglutathione lyase family enzyme